MSYIDRIIEPGETVQHRAQVHWFVYIPGLLWWAIAAGAVWVGRNPEAMTAVVPLEFTPIIAGIAAFAGIVAGTGQLLTAFIQRRSTELVVTDRRVIAKVGFVRRNTSEINRPKVEGVRVDQSVLGRIFDFGTIRVQGTGGGTAPMRNIDDPIAFRNAVSSGAELAAPAVGLVVNADDRVAP